MAGSILDLITGAIPEDARAQMAAALRWFTTPDTPAVPRAQAPSPAQEAAKPALDILRGATLGTDWTQPSASDPYASGAELLAAGLPLIGLGGKALKGLRAFHGSPHSFDRFDVRKLGSGQGAQTYGHGLYFAEAEPVAESYRDQMAGKFARYLHPWVDPSGAWRVAETSGVSSGQWYLPEKYATEREAAEVAHRLMDESRQGHMYEVN